MGSSHLLKGIFFVPLVILLLERILGIAKYQTEFFTSLSTIELGSLENPEEVKAANDFYHQESKSNHVDSDKKDEEVSHDTGDEAEPMMIPLDALVKEEERDCGDGTVAAPYKHLPYVGLFSGGRRVPRIVHQTSKTRCVTPLIQVTVENWLLGDDWAYYFHSDEAIARLFAKHWPEFPHLKEVIKCIEGKGTLKADLWRYLVLYEYGGIYSDVDTKPAKFNATTIQPSDDGFFTVEQYHLLSQYFMATSPRHPIMYYTIHSVLQGLLDQKDTGGIPAPQVTGPHALNRGYQYFMRDKGVKIQPAGAGMKPAKAGLWIGTDNRSITVAGIGENENEYVIRESIRRSKKIEEYKSMGMQHFTRDSSVKSDKTCLRTLWDAGAKSREQLDIQKSRTN